MTVTYTRAVGPGKRGAGAALWAGSAACEIFRERAVQTITPPSGPGIGGVRGKQLFYTKMTVGENTGEAPFRI